MMSVCLSTFEAFADLDEDALQSISEYFRLQLVPASTYVISNEIKSSEVYFLIDGSIRVCAFSEHGKQVQFEDLSHGMMFGEMSAIDGAERSGDCIAIKNSTLAVVSAEHFNIILREHPSVSAFVLQRLVALVRKHMSRVYEFSTSTVSQRVRYELLRMASNSRNSGRNIVIEKPPTHADIAARISTHREAVTRELKVLENEGVITWRPGSHVIRNVIGLTAQS